MRHLLQILKTLGGHGGLLVDDLMPLCPLWTGPHRLTNAEIENHFRRVKQCPNTGPRKSLDEFVLSRYRDSKYLLNRAVSCVNQEIL